MKALELALTALEDMLVTEFRTCQLLHVLVREERKAMLQGNNEALKKILQDKETCLAELKKLENSCRDEIQEIGLLHGMASTCLKLKDILPKIERFTADRMLHLSKGTDALVQEIQEINQGNQALAKSKQEEATNPSRDNQPTPQNGNGRKHLEISQRQDTYLFNSHK